MASSPPVTDESLTRWREQSDALTNEEDELSAFSKFADLEDAMEPIEDKITAMVTEIDQAIQQEVDRMRGK
ncbi:hypothetical protein ACFPM7_20190 [Actinokineospora guangxiensis]|uniref:Uncharacterized protein n=1 Tax=Actinokineospora guangxiensis TaxID=1490288 RepID=A0ABW0EPX2_9PSEU